MNTILHSKRVHSIQFQAVLCYSIPFIVRNVIHALVCVDTMMCVCVCARAECSNMFEIKSSGFEQRFKSLLLNELEYYAMYQNVDHNIHYSYCECPINFSG